MSDWDPTVLTGSFPMTAGQTAYVYVRDTVSGDLPLSNPLDVHVTATACTEPPAVTFDPPAGGTTRSRWPLIRARFGAPVYRGHGTITIAGESSPTLSYDLATSPSEVTLTEGNLVMEIQSPSPFLPGEMLTITIEGVSAIVCDETVTLPTQTWSVQTVTPPCLPGVGGLVGTTLTAVPTDLTSTLFEYYVEADDDPNGYVYYGGTSDLYRTPKAGGAREDIAELAELSTAHLGYAMLIDGPNIYTIESKTSGSFAHIFRISTDGGTTWNREDYADFLTAPSDDFRAAVAYGGRIYLVTEEDSATVPTEIWSVDAAATTLPAVATLEHSLADIGGDCNGLARDASYFYLLCDDGTGGLYRLPVAGGATELITSALEVNATAGSLQGADIDGDGVFDVLYIQTWTEAIDYVCNPAGATPFYDHFSVIGDGTSNYGMGLDRTTNVLWIYDDDDRQLYSIQ